MRSQVGGLVLSMLALAAATADAGTGQQGVSLQGVSLQGVSLQGVSLQGVSLQGVSLQGVSLQGVSLQGVSLQGSQLTGWSGSTYVQGQAIEGAYTSVTLSNGSTAQLYFWDAKTDTTQNTLSNPAYKSNSDVWLYRVLMLTDQGWVDTCGGDHYGIMMTGAWNASGQYMKGGPTLACTSGVIAKCARNWGYKPWKSLTDAYGQVHSTGGMRTLHSSCVHAARAAYCGNEVSFTQDGNAVDMWDNYGLNTPLDEDAAHGMFGMEAYFESKGAYQIFDETRNGDWGEINDGCHAGGHVSENYDLKPAPGTINGVAYPNLRQYLVDGAWTSPQTAYSLGLRHIAVSTSTHCPHSPAETGDPMGLDCNSCTEAVCAEMPDCCVSNKFYYGDWSGACVSAAEELCGDQLWSSPRPWFDDEYEDNDTRATAKTFWFGYLNGLWATGTDRDWFKLIFGGTVRIDFDHAAGNLDLRVYNSSGTLVSSSATTNNYELVSVPSGGYVEVYGATSTVANLYHMEIGGYGADDAIASTRCSYANYGTSMDNDPWLWHGYYAAFGVCNGGSAYFQAEYALQVKVTYIQSIGNLDVQVYDQNGAFLSGSYGTTGVEVVNVPANGHVRVYGAGGATNEFKLSILDKTASPDFSIQSAGSEPTLARDIHVTGDTDDITIPFAGTVQVAFEHSRGDIDVQAYDRNGNYLGSSTGVSDLEEIFVPTGGKIRVYGYGGATNGYSVAVIR